MLVDSVAHLRGVVESISRSPIIAARGGVMIIGQDSTSSASSSIVLPIKDPLNVVSYRKLDLSSVLAMVGHKTPESPVIYILLCFGILCGTGFRPLGRSLPSWFINRSSTRGGNGGLGIGRR